MFRFTHSLPAFALIVATASFSAEDALAMNTGHQDALQALQNFGVFGDTPRGDDRVRQALDFVGLDYEVDEDGDFELIFVHPHAGKRLVLIFSDTFDRNGVEMRSIVAPVSVFQGQVPQHVLQVVDELNLRSSGVESYQLISDGQGQVILVMEVEIPANAVPEHLAEIVRVTVRTSLGLSISLGL